MAEGQHAPTSNRRTTLIVIGVIVVLALVGVAIVALSGGGEGPLGAIVDDEPDAVPFDFQVGEPKPIVTAAKSNGKEAAEAAAAPAEAVVEQIDELYTAGFLDPANWDDAEYETVLELFDRGAADEAGTQLDVLTAGPNAGELESIEPMASTLRIQVLLSPTGTPTAVEGSARFRALGTGATGDVRFDSRGEFIFEKVDGSWVIVSFSVTRSDDEVGSAPSASGSASSGEGADGS